jgi:phosphoenolpyruvate-protein kinase (PTS system EI component)
MTIILAGLIGRPDLSTLAKIFYKPHAWSIELGIMVEIPSAALLAPVLA